MSDTKKGREGILNALQMYVDMGLPVIPLCSHDHKGYSPRHVQTCKQAGKIPLIKGWREQQVTTIEQVRSWIKEFPNFNIGLPLGSNSGYVGIDIDGYAGEDMLEEISDGDVPETWEFATGAGRRLLYTIPVGLATKKFVNPGEGIHEECSIICEGQQTVMPPSIHHTGRIYQWEEGSSPEDIDCAPAPVWLLDLIRLDKAGSSKSPGGSAIASSPESIDVNPIVVSDAIMASEFSNYSDMPLDATPPKVEYGGKDVKQQAGEDNKVSESELTQKITSGNRDNQMTRIIGSFCANFRSMGKDYIMHMAKSHNLTYCDPPLDDFAVESKVNHFWETEAMKSSKYKKGAAAGEKAALFAPGEIAQVVLNMMESKGYVIKVDPEHPIVWMTQKTHGPWKPIDTRNGSFQVYIRDALGNEKYGGNPAWTTIRHYKDVANALVVELRAQERVWKVNSRNLDTQTITQFQYIPLAGGKLLDWKTGQVHPWDPETNLTYVLPVEYNPTAKSESWDARMKEWLPDEGARLIMQEFIGYALIPYMGFEKALVIQGEGANGKSLFLETIQGLLGYDVVDSINMRTLFSRFGSSSLVGKVLNIVNEAGSEYLRGGAADDFKNLVSGGRIIADVKNQSPITFNNTAKFIFASNHDIKTGDKSEGWLRRMLIVPFEQDFTQSVTPKFEIMEQLRAEYSGIFNWALEGLRRLVANQAFSDSTTANAKKMAYTRENDITADFFMNCLEAFDLESMANDGKIVRYGTPSSFINYIFDQWITYRESSVQKKVEHLSKYLEKKHRLSKARTTHTLHVQKVMTECWIGLRLNITDTGFLEFLITEMHHGKFTEVIKKYATEKLAEIDLAEGRASENGSPGAPLIDLTSIREQAK